MHDGTHARRAMYLPPWVRKPQVWVFHAAVGGAALALISLAMLKPVWALGYGLLTGVAATAARILARRDPTPMPYAMRWILFAPRFFQSARQLRALLDLKGGERLLEIGPGVGTYSLPMASALGTGGT
ncbi:MAG: hypothetical protein HY548_08710, partial [Elusimicrobia bacterium]|nr:hypothetical protein [Elusimicrobiota bacterium]